MKAGGNASQSYIVCKDCHSRWETHFRAAAMREDLKMENQRKRMGPASQMEVEPVQEWMGSTYIPPQPKAAPAQRSWESPKAAAMAYNPPEHMMQQEIRRMEQEMRAMRQEAYEKELQQERKMQAAMRQHQQQLDEAMRMQVYMQVPATPNRAHMTATATPSRASTDQISMPPTPEAMAASLTHPVRCNCNMEAERLQMKKEGTRKGRFFYKCIQRECKIFAWEPRMEENKTPKRTRPSSEAGSWKEVTERTGTSVVNLVSEGEDL